jgi:hypothetical protein
MVKANIIYIVVVIYHLLLLKRQYIIIVPYTILFSGILAPQASCPLKVGCTEHLPHTYMSYQTGFLFDQGIIL